MIAEQIDSTHYFFDIELKQQRAPNFSMQTLSVRWAVGAYENAYNCSIEFGLLRQREWMMTETLPAIRKPNMTG
jgi:hypothetical protein